jgi:DNA (cytosine-5)-methyltransferase 1
LFDLSSIGYDAEWHCIPASELGANHHRDRVWIVAYPQHDGHTASEKGRGARESAVKGREKKQEGIKQFERGHTQPVLSENVADTNSPQRKRNRSAFGILAEYADFSGTSWWETESSVGRVAHGVPSGAHRLKALGNAVVPQIPEIIGRAIMEYENATQINQKD